MEASNEEYIEIQNPMNNKKTADYLENYLHGNCHLFALALHQELNFEMEFLWDLEAEFHGPQGIKYGKALVHAYCIRPDGTLVDASGTISYDDAENEYGEVNEPEYEKITVQKLTPLINNKFLSKAEKGEIENLREHIRTYRTFYEEEC